MASVLGNRFVVGTGRCGSTLLSRMLAEHPAVLSAAELFSMAQPGALPAGTIDGERFWRVLSEPREEMTLLLRHRVEPDEFRYPVDGPGRFDRESGVPPIALICLPSLTDDPDALYDELERPLRRLPPASAGTQYTALLKLLAKLLGKRVWVERSGDSLRFVRDVLDQFDSPKILHLHRDGIDTALSMSRHSSYRIRMMRGLGAVPDPFSGRAFRAAPIPVERFGRLWSATILQGTRRLAALPAGDVAHLSYERLVAEPAAELARLAELLALPDPHGPWRERAAAVIDPQSPSTARSSLSAAELEGLRQACAPGERRLSKLAASRGS